MNAYLIDPQSGTVSELTLPESNHLKALKEAIDCDVIDLVSGVIPGHDIYIDDEGLLKQPFRNGLFKFGPDNVFDGIIAGRGVVVSHNRAGETTGATCSVDDVINTIRQVVYLDSGQELVETKPLRAA